PGQVDQGAVAVAVVGGPLRPDGLDGAYVGVDEPQIAAAVAKKLAGVLDPPTRQEPGKGESRRASAGGYSRLERRSFTFDSIRSRTLRNSSSGSSLGSGMFQSSRRFARTSGQSSPHPIVTATSTSFPLNASSDFEACAERSYPFSAMNCTARGFTLPDGRLPAEWASTSLPPWRRANASAIWLRFEFSTQTNRIRFFGLGSLMIRTPHFRNRNTGPRGRTRRPRRLARVSGWCGGLASRDRQEPRPPGSGCRRSGARPTRRP